MTMKKIMYVFSSLILVIFVAACTVDAYESTTKRVVKEEDKPLSETYTATHPYCLNVMYYVPADVDSLPEWHRRLSGLTVEMRDFFLTNMKRYQHNKTFGLVVNDSNQFYVKIAFLKSKFTASQMQLKNIETMKEEVLAYYSEHPDEKTSNHFLVYLPEYDGSFVGCVYADPSGSGVPDHGIAFVGCDAEKFDPKYNASARGRTAYLARLGSVMKELVHAFFVSDDCGSAASGQYALTGSLGARIAVTSGKVTQNMYNCELWAENPDKVNFTEACALWLSQNQVFAKEDDQHEYRAVQVEIQDVRFRFFEGVIYADCIFQTTDEVVGAVMYNDGWIHGLDPYTFIGASNIDNAYNQDENSRTDGDALSYCVTEFETVDEGAGVYKASFECNVDEDLHSRNVVASYDSGLGGDDPSTENFVEENYYMKAEIRFRFIGKGGMSCPHTPVSLKGTWGSKFRWPFHYRRARPVGAGFGVFAYLPDLESRYPQVEE